MGGGRELKNWETEYYGPYSVAGIYDSGNDGPTIMLRCELDALPIQEISDLPHKSQDDGKAHLCGHDGHMAILIGVSRWLGKNRPHKGRVVLLFQPAEEDGAGAAKVISDPRFTAIKPDISLALHNYPNLPLGHGAIIAGPMNCASRGMKIRLFGRTAHASEPENGVSPALAIASLIPALTALKRGEGQADPAFVLTTITHAELGEPAFGVAPGEGAVWAEWDRLRMKYWNGFENGWIVVKT